MRINELPLSDEIIKILTDAKLFFVSDLINMSDRELSYIPRLGKGKINQIKKSLNLFKKSEAITIEKQRYLSDLQTLIHTELLPFKHEINELRTILCEQYRLLQSIQLEKRPEGIVNRIDDKIPGFSGIIYDLYKKIENTVT